MNYYKFILVVAMLLSLAIATENITSLVPHSISFGNNSLNTLSSRELTKRFQWPQARWDYAGIGLAISVLREGADSFKNMLVGCIDWANGSAQNYGIDCWGTLLWYMLQTAAWGYGVHIGVVNVQNSWAGVAKRDAIDWHNSTHYHEAIGIANASLPYNVHHIQLNSTSLDNGITIYGTLGDLSVINHLNSTSGVVKIGNTPANSKRDDYYSFGEYVDGVKLSFDHSCASNNFYSSESSGMYNLAKNFAYGSTYDLPSDVYALELFNDGNLQYSFYTGLLVIENEGYGAQYEAVPVGPLYGC